MPRRPMTFEEKVNSAHERIQSLTHLLTDEYGVITCRVPVDPGGTILTRKSNGTYYASFGKRKVPIHKIEYIYHRGKVPEGKEISHLCQDHDCCKISHLHAESHGDNMARIGCPGWLMFEGREDKLICACGHTPRCLKVTRLPIETIEPTELDQ